MRAVIMTIILIGIALAAYTLFIQDGVWNDTKTIDGRKDISVNGATIPIN